MFQIGQHIWAKSEWSGAINEGIITAIDLENGQLSLKGIDLPGRYGVDIKHAFPSKEEALAHEQTRKRQQIEDYKQELLQGILDPINKADTIQLLANIVSFTTSHAVAPCEEYTDWDARTAVQELVAERLHWLPISMD